ncbi:MAG TPA: hypothetical protein VGR26_18595 [Acidimicrobiales bacterium]|nr:hypothetical protein [Acidimicrobiales bacterium]
MTAVPSIASHLRFMQIRLTGRLARDLAASSGRRTPDYVVVLLTNRPDGQSRRPPQLRKKLEPPDLFPLATRAPVAPPGPSRQ